MKYNFEKNVIDVILNTIKDNQIYLTQPENLPQLAKLGYMYNTLWYAGRICYGYKGIISDGNECEDNPKYKIEMCEPQTEEIDSLIYDAWGMHITSGDNSQPSWEVFSNIIYNGQELTDIEKKELKVNKTIDDWVDIFTDDNYTYKSLFGSRRGVLDYLLCTIGTGYGFKDGCVYEEASGADEDIAIYGDWKNALFNKTIQEIVNNLMSIPEVEETIQKSYLFIKNEIEKRKKEEEERDKKLFDFLSDGADIDELIKRVLDGRKNKTPIEDKYQQFYPISKYSNISKIDENSDISYIKAGIEICNDILQNSDKEEKCNVDFATTYVNRFKQFNI